MLGAALTLVFFAPLAIVYARFVARRVHGRAAGRSALGAGLRRLVLPALILVGLTLRFSGAENLAALPPLLAHNPFVRLLSAGLVFIGNAALILFFLAIPYVLGTVLGVIAALLGYWRGDGGGDAAPSGPPLPDD